ncbi:MAG TPA: hypothetical protein VIK53_09785 [Verrucomicrobiae bacterium]
MNFKSFALVAIFLGLGIAGNNTCSKQVSTASGWQLLSNSNGATCRALAIFCHILLDIAGVLLIDGLDSGALK